MPHDNIKVQPRSFCCTTYKTWHMTTSCVNKEKHLGPKHICNVLTITCLPRTCIRFSFHRHVHDWKGAILTCLPPFPLAIDGLLRFFFEFDGKRTHIDAHIWGWSLCNFGESYEYCLKLTQSSSKYWILLFRSYQYIHDNCISIDGVIF